MNRSEPSSRCHFRGRVLSAVFSFAAFLVLQFTPFVFTQSAHAVPPVLSAPAQLEDNGGACLGGETPIPEGDPIDAQNICLGANVTDGDGDTILIEIELQPVSTSFTCTGTGPCSGPEVFSTSLSSNANPYLKITGLVYGTSYHWQARAVDPTEVSAWVPFGTNLETDADFTPVNQAPVITSLDQRIDRGNCNTFSGATVAAPADIGERSICLEAGGSDAIDTEIRFEFEVQPVNTAFDGLPSSVVCFPVDCTSTVSQGLYPVLISGLVFNVGDHWRVQVIDDQGMPSSSWSPFGGNTDPGDIDFRPVNAAPVISALQQYTYDGNCVSNPVAPLGDPIVTRTICLSANITDGNPLQLEIELKDVDTPFNGSGLVCFPDDCSFTTSGTYIATVTGLISGTAYHWRARAMDDGGLPSLWLAFDGGDILNVDSTDPASTDFSVSNPAPTIDFLRQSIAPTGACNFGTSVPEGGSISELEICLEANNITDAPSVEIRLEVEWQIVGTPFIGDTGPTNLICVPVNCGGTDAADFTTQGSLAVKVIGLSTAVGYIWQARAVDDLGSATHTGANWFQFETEDINIADFAVANDPPVIRALDQKKTTGSNTRPRN